MKTLLTLVTILAAAACTAVDDAGNSQSTESPGRSSTNLGAFSVSLAVEDLAASRAFYEKLGFEMKGGEPTQNWIILRNGDITIGLFQGMFEKNILTFNPGWTRDAEPMEQFTDIREIQRRLEADGLEMVTRADESTTGPASFVIVDPDGNSILFDQHVD